MSPTAPSRTFILSWWPLAATLLIALAGFQLIFGFRLAAAGDAYWSNPHGDMGQMLAGEIAGLRASWSVPILTPATLLAPDRVSLVYTDSIPWFTALLKLTHLGKTFSLLGTFLLLAWVVQPAAMYALLRAAGVRRALTLMVGALLALLFPAWLGRQIGHIALSGQAIELSALALTVRAARAGLDRAIAIAFVSLGILAAGVHAYHVPMVAALLAAALVSEVTQKRPKALARAAVTGAAFVAAVLFAAWFLGYFVGRGASGGGDALGLYEMNLIAPLLPQGSALAGQKWANGWFTGVFDPTGHQSYEGYNYLGVGVLLILSSAVILLFWSDPNTINTQAEHQDSLYRAPIVSWRRWGPLAITLVLLTLYAAGTKPYVGTVRLFVLPLPHAGWMEPLALFRCHGRFFWPVGYALLAAGVTVLDRRAGPRLRNGVLLTALVLQLLDMSQMFVGLRGQFAGPEPLHVPEALRGPGFRGRDVRVYPAFFCTGSPSNQLMIRQLAVIAERQGASINSAPTARPPVGACERSPPADALVDAAPGDRRITVLMGDALRTSALTSLFARRTDCFSYGAVWMCGRGLSAVPGLTPAAGGELRLATHTDAALQLHTPAFKAALLSGWSEPGELGVWSQGSHAILRLPHPDLPDGVSLTLTVEALSFQPAGRSPQRAFVSVNGRRLAEWRLEGPGYTPMQVVVPASMLKAGREFDVDLDLPDAVSPNDVQPGSGDPRKLGIGIRRITLMH